MEETGVKRLEKKTIRKGMEYYIEMEALSGETYEYEMCMRNSIDNLLPMVREQVDHREQVSYDITGCTRLEDKLSKMWITKVQLQSIVENLISVIQNVKRYLLYPDNLMISMEDIYLDERDYQNVSGRNGMVTAGTESDAFIGFSQLKFMYVPGYQRDLSDQIRRFLEEVTERVDKQDTEAVLLAWHLHTVAKSDRLNMKDLEGCLCFPCQEPVEQKPVRNENWEEEYQRCRSKRRVEQKPVRSEVWEENDGWHRSKQREKQDRRVKECRTEEAETAFFIRRRYKIPLIALALLEIVFLAGEGWILYQIYFYGILEWKRNVFLLDSGALVINAAIWCSLLKKQKEEEKLQELFDKKEKMPEEEVIKEKWNFNKGTEKNRRERNSIERESMENMYRYGTEKRNETEVFYENTTLLGETREESFPRLLSMDGKNEDIVIAFTPFVIGKSQKEADYQMKQSVISRIHARITRREYRYYIEDMASTNGTFLNQQKIKQGRFYEIKAGDMVRLADLEFMFSIVPVMES